MEELGGEKPVEMTSLQIEISQNFSLPSLTHPFGTPPNGTALLNETLL